MKVKALCERLGARVLCGTADGEFEGVYTGDLLSRAMSRVEYGCAWVTIMANINVVAVANLTEPALIVLAEDVIMQEDALSAAQENQLCVISTPMSAYEICCAIHEMAGE
ncbi:MAG: AraC family transcriptional regulator [Ruminococcaceae bacterium]|nr:AraC family transcriptional regulator [Oscillospiraceae bacterium]MBE6697249.1 AraC family transcriptional regulator [Oscillospiraceae bacterium]